MIDSAQNIQNYNLSIYDPITPDDKALFIPIYTLEKLISKHLIGYSLNGLPLRTRSKVVKALICEALGYPIPRTFKKTQPRFPGQNFDVYTQKSLNVQIWNEEVDASRRYVFLQIDENDIISNVRVISGNVLAQFDRTGKLTTKYQATMNHFDNSYLFSKDSPKISNWISYPHDCLHNVNPNCCPSNYQLLSIEEIFDRLSPLVGIQIDYPGSLQERNRGAELHALICKYPGYGV